MAGGGGRADVQTPVDVVVDVARVRTVVDHVDEDSLSSGDVPDIS